MRATERDFLAEVANRITPGVFGEIVQAAVDAARAGDAKARAWVTELVLPAADRPTLSALARREALGVTAEDEIRGAIEFDATPWLDRNHNTPLAMIESAKLRQAEDEAEAAERARRKAERAARKAARTGNAPPPAE